MEQLLCTEQIEKKHMIRESRRIVLCLLTGLSMVLCLCSMFGIELDFTGILKSGILSGLLCVRNQIVHTLLVEEGLVFPEVEGASEDGTLFLLVLAVCFAVLIWFLIKSGFSCLLLIPGAVIVLPLLLFDVETGLWQGALFAFGMMCVFLEIRMERGVSGWQMLYAAGILILLCVVVGDFGAAQERRIRASLEETVEKLRYGENLLENGKVTAKERAQAKPEEAAALEITMQRPQELYLRGFVGELYTDGRWRALPYGAYEENRDLFYWLDREAFRAAGQLQQAEALLDGKGPVNQIEVDVKQACKKYAYVPYEIGSFDQEVLSWYGAYFTAGNVGSMKHYSYKAGDNLVSKWTDVAARFQLQSEKAQEDDEAYLVAESYYNEFVYEHYTYLSETEKALLAPCVQGEAADVKTAIEKVRAYLDETMVYTENPALASAETEDMLEAFLTEHKGYDVHYATAATLLFRAYGIPARYVEGYLVTKEDVRGAKQGEPFEIPRANIHAWTEVYIDGVGFVPIETCENYRALMEEADLTIGIRQNGAKEHYEDSSVKIRSLLETESEEKTEAEHGFLRPLLYVLGFLCLAMVLLYGLYRLFRFAVYRVNLEIRFCQKDRKAAVSAMYGYLAQQKRVMPTEVKELGDRASYSRMRITEKEWKQMRVFLRKGIWFVFLVVVSVVNLTACKAEKSTTVEAENRMAAKWVREATEYPSVGAVGGCWAVKGVAESNADEKRDSAWFSLYLDDVRAEVKSKKGVLDTVYYTTYARVIIALAALGENPQDIEGYNLVSPLEDYEKVTSQGANAAAYALIAAHEADTVLAQEEQYLNFLLGKAETLSESDMLAMVVEGLSLYRDREDVMACIEKCLGILSEQQQEDGSFGTCESTAEVIIAATAAGVDVRKDERFIKENQTLFDGLLVYRNRNGYVHQKGDNETNAMATEKALLALDSLRLSKEGASLY